MKKCNICKSENANEVHYCVKCGKNLSDRIEVTDFLHFVGTMAIFLAVGGVVVMLVFDIIRNTFLSLSNDGTFVSFDFYIVCIGVFVVGVAVKLFAYKMCKQNVTKSRCDKGCDYEQ